MATVVTKPLSGNARRTHAFGKGMSGIAALLQPLAQKNYEQKLKQEQMQWERGQLEESLDAAMLTMKDKNLTPMERHLTAQKALLPFIVRGGTGDKSSAELIKLLTQMGVASETPGNVNAIVGQGNAIEGQENAQQQIDPLESALEQQHIKRATGSNALAENLINPQAGQAPMRGVKPIGQPGRQNPADLKNALNEASPNLYAENIAQGAGFHGGGLNALINPQEFKNKLIPPEKINEARDFDLRKGRVDLPTVAAMQSHNQEIVNHDSQVTAMAVNKASLSKASLENQGAWNSYKDMQAKKFGIDLSNQQDSQLFNEIADAPIMANEDRLDKRFNASMDMYNRYKNLQDSIIKNQQRSNWDQFKYKEDMKLLASEVKPFLEMGLYGMVERDLAKGGYGQIEIAEITNNLPKESYKILSQGKSYKQLRKAEETLAANIGFMTEQEKNNVTAQIDDTHATLKADWKEKIAEVVNKRSGELTKGLSMIPGPNLLLIRREFLAKGGKMSDFNSIIVELEDEGRISLDPSQQEQKTYFSKTPEQLQGLWQIFLNALPGYQAKE